MPDRLEQDRDLKLRHYVQWLDKAVRKSASLKRMDLKSYVARTHLGECLWELFERGSFGDFDEQDGQAEKARFRKRWEGKVHPYARHAVSWHQPESDGNAAELRQRADITEPVGRTSWTDVFAVPIGSFARQDYRAAAETIEAHLYNQELKVDGDDRLQDGKSSGYGLVQERGYIISCSTNDPRAKEKHERYTKWSESEERLYGKPGDLAAEIFQMFRSKPRDGEPRKRIGQVIYQHFGRLKAETGTAGASQELWNLHNAIRHHYRRTVESRRFLEAVRSEDVFKLGHLLPRDMGQLYGRLGGRRRASDIGRLVRLGKLIAHSVDLCFGFDTKGNASTFDAMVRAAMDYYATSVGQADIKRNETFTRLLRTSVAFSLRTHATWLKPGLEEFLKRRRSENSKAIGLSGEGGSEEEIGQHEEAIANRDISTLSVGAGAVEHMPIEQIGRFGEIIFGTKPYDVSDLPRIGSAENAPRLLSRSASLFDSSETDREVLWGLLQLAAQIRNRVYHFGSKKRFVEALQTGLIRAAPAGQDIKPIGSRDGRTVEYRGCQKLEKLLDFDLGVDKNILLENLNRLRFASHVPAEKRRGALKILARVPASDDWVTPKFIAVLNKAHNLSTTEPDTLQVLKSFASLQLHDLSKDQGSLNHDRVGLLRLLYDRAFANWLEEKENDQELAQKLFSEIRSNKRARRDAFDKATGRVYSDDDVLAERLLTEAKTLSDLQLLLQTEAMLVSQPRADDSRLRSDAIGGRQATSAGETQDNLRAHENPYIPDRQRQAEVSGRIQDLRLEIYAFLFNCFLEDQKLEWIWSFGEPRETDGSAEPTLVTADEIPEEGREYPSWLRQFYAWLYLVPVDQVALLRHQFRKTAILEQKGARDRDAILWSNRPTGLDREVLLLLGPDPSAKLAADADHAPTKSADKEVLRALDRAMGLYGRVQAAGFSGSETSLDRLPFAGNAALKELYSDKEDMVSTMLPGTLAGLRSLERFGTLSILTGIFRKHRVMRSEVAVLRNLMASGDLTPFQQKQDLHKKLRQHARAKPCDERQLREDARAYHAVAGQVCNYNFAISAARLADFANVHHLLMNILARLMDFTAIWDRDRDCVLLALSYETQPELKFVRRGGTMALETPDAGQVDVFTTRDGFANMHRKEQMAGLCGVEDIPWAGTFFGLFKGPMPKRGENSKDAAFRVESNLRNKGKENYVPIKENIGHHFALHQIRNDLAHFNVLDQVPHPGRPGEKKSRGDVNLTYLVNAVRALLSYDRKLKNSVPKAIADILQREGIALSWRFARDRMRSAELSPVLLPHLEFLRLKGTRNPSEAELLSFMLPAVSPRELSMAKALFDFGTSGYLEDARPDVRRLAYPPHCRGDLEGARVPSVVLDTLELGSETSK